MNKIIILGGSVAGVKAAELLRSQDAEASICVLSMDGNYPYVRERLSAFLAQKISNEAVFYQPESYYKKHKIDILLEQQVTRINFKRNKIFTSDKEQLGFTHLIIADMPCLISDTKGKNKSGVYHMRSLNDIYTVIKQCVIVETTAVQSGTLDGLDIALALRVPHKKEVRWIIPAGSGLAGLFRGEFGERWNQLLDEQGIQAMAENAIEAFLGETELRAIRLKSGKVLACDMALLGESDNDFRLINDGTLAIEGKVRVDQNGGTTYPHVYAVDQPAAWGGDSQTSTDYPPVDWLEVQGATAAGHISGQEPISGNFVMIRTVSLVGAEICQIGQAVADPAIEVIGEDEDGLGSYKAIFIRDGRASGALLVNAPEYKDICQKLVENRVPLSGEESFILEDELDFTAIQSRLSSPEMQSVPETGEMDVHDQQENPASAEAE